MKSVYRFLVECDILGSDLTLYFQDSKTIKTVFGGLCSMTIFFIFVLLLIGFGNDFFTRKNPSFIKSSVSLGKVPFHTVSNNDFFFGLRLESYDLLEINRPDLFEINLNYINYYMNKTTGEYVIQNTEVELVECNSTFIENFVNFDGLMCPLFNNTSLGGSYTQDSAQILEVFVNVCPDGGFSKKGVKCSSIEEKILAIDNFIFFTIYYQKAVVNPDDYYNGISRSISTEYHRISKNLVKYVELYFVEYEINTDYGWMLTDKKQSSIFGLSHYKNHIDYDPFSLVGSKSRFVAGASIYFSTEKERYRREYVKIQTLAAQVGGILKLLLEIGLFIVGKINLHYCQLSLLNLLSKKTTVCDNDSLYNNNFLNQYVDKSKNDSSIKNRSSNSNLNNNEALVNNFFLKNNEINPKKVDLNNNWNSYYPKNTILNTKFNNNYSLDLPKNRLCITISEEIQPKNNFNIIKKTFQNLNDYKQPTITEEASFSTTFMMTIYLSIGRFDKKFLFSEKRYHHYFSINKAFQQQMSIRELLQTINLSYYNLNKNAEHS